MTHEQIKDLIDFYFTRKGYETEVDLNQTHDALDFLVTVKFSQDSKEDPTFFVYSKTKKVSIMAFYVLSNAIKVEDVETFVNDLSKELPAGYDIDQTEAGSKEVVISKTVDFENFHEEFLLDVEEFFTKPNAVVSKLRNFDTN